MEASVRHACLPSASAGVELSHEGEPAQCCWLMEAGVVLACNMKGDVHRLHAPCLFGEALFLGQEVLACRCAPCTFVMHFAQQQCYFVLPYVSCH